MLSPSCFWQLLCFGLCIWEGCGELELVPEAPGVWGQPGVLCFALHSLNASLNNLPSPQGLLAVFALDKFCIRPSLCIQAWEKIIKLSKNII